MTVKITSLEAENIKRIKAVQLTPSENGLTVIGGRNGQGKTSVLDAIAWALGGNKMRPSEPHRSGSVQDPDIKITLNNGLIVERKGKNSDLKVTDPTGQKSGQRILDALIGEMALNVPKFMAGSPKEKADYLLKVIGVGKELKVLEKQEAELSSERLYVGQQGRKAKGHLESLKHYEGVGTEEITASELIFQQQEILIRNGEKAAKRKRKDDYEAELKRLDQKIREMEIQLDKLREDRGTAFINFEQAKMDAMDLIDESTEEIEKKLTEIDMINQRVRTNREYARAEQDVNDMQAKYSELTESIQNVRDQKRSLLDNAPLPLSGLSVENGVIFYKGHEWDCMSGSDQLKVAAAICRAMNPNCGFVLLDKLEQMDSETLNEFGRWLESEGLQAIATRVSTGDECSVIIEDGMVKGLEPDYFKETKSWNQGGNFEW